MKKINSIYGIEPKKTYLVDRSRMYRKYEQDYETYNRAFSDTILYQIIFAQRRIDLKKSKSVCNFYIKCDSYWLRSRWFLALEEILDKTKIHLKQQWGFTGLREKHFEQFDIYELSTEEDSKIKAQIMLNRIVK